MNFVGKGHVTCALSISFRPVLRCQNAKEKIATLSPPVSLNTGPF